jgi:hypothetical protein
LRTASSTLRELVAIRVALSALHAHCGHLPLWHPDTILVLHADSASALFCVTRGNSVCPIASAVVRAILSIAAQPSAPRLVPNHRPRERNEIADALSHPPTHAARLLAVRRGEDIGPGIIRTGYVAGWADDVGWDE